MTPTLHRIPEGAIRDSEHPHRAHRCCVFCKHMEAREIDVSAFNHQMSWRFSLHCRKHDFESGGDEYWCDDFDWK